jgi:hypothetical protein
MSITRKKGSMRKVYLEDAEIFLSQGQDQLIKEIDKLVLVLGSTANEFGILIRVTGSPHEIQQARALVDHV